VGGGRLQGNSGCRIAGPQLRTDALSGLPIALRWILVPRTQAQEKIAGHKFTRMGPFSAILRSQNGPPDG